MCEEKLNNHIDSEHGDNLIGDPHEEISYLENKLVSNYFITLVSIICSGINNIFLIRLMMKI